MGQEACEQYVLDKNESEDYDYVKDVKKNPEPGIGSYHDLLDDGRYDFRCRKRARVYTNYFFPCSDL